MIGYIVKKFIGSKNDREVKRLRPLVARINALEAELQQRSEDVLRQKTAAWKEELSKIQDNDELARRLDEILPEAFAVVKNACRRLCGTEIIVREHPLTWEMVPFDVQLIGGYALHSGTNRGNGDRRRQDPGRHPAGLPQRPHRPRRARGHGQRLPGRPRQRMDGRGLQVPRPDGRLHPARPAAPPSAASNTTATSPTAPTPSSASITCATTAWPRRKEEQVQRGHYYAIVDEVDSILIDEARTPLIISGPAVVTYDEQYANFKPQVEALFHAQERLCNRFLSEAEEPDAQAPPGGRLEPREPRGSGARDRAAALPRQDRPAQVRGPA